MPKQKLSYVLLKDGTMLEATSDQKAKIAFIVLITKNPKKKKIKLNGKTFSLWDIEDDPKKVFASQQQTMQLGDKSKKRIDN